MASKFSLDTKAFDDAMQEQIAEGAEVLTRVMAQTQIVQIRRRVEQGRGLDDAPMPPYAASTRQQRQKKGRQVARRDLTDSGSMLRSMHVESVNPTSTGYEATLSFANREDALKAAVHQRRHPWFGVSPEDERGLQDHLGRILAEKIAAGREVIP